jgi:hypothetical protein
LIPGGQDLREVSFWPWSLYNPRKDIAGISGTARISRWSGKRVILRDRRFRPAALHDDAREGNGDKKLRPQRALRPRAPGCHLSLVACALIASFAFSAACSSPAAKAKGKLARKGLEFSASAFLERLVAGDSEAVKLFLSAGMSPHVAGGGYTALLEAARHDTGEFAYENAGASKPSGKGSSGADWGPGSSSSTGTSTTATAPRPSFTGTAAYSTSARTSCRGTRGPAQPEKPARARERARRSMFPSPRVQGTRKSSTPLNGGCGRRWTISGRQAFANPFFVFAELKSSFSGLKTGT